MRIKCGEVSQEVLTAKARTLRLLAPPERLLVSEWASRYRILSRKDSARPGRWHTDPHQGAIMDAFVEPGVSKIVVMAASQVVGKSQMMNCALGYFIDIDPSNVMMVFPTLGDAEKWSKGRLDPLIESTPRLADKIKSRKSRTSENTLYHRQFHGGQMFIVGANAPSGLSAQSVRIVIADEIDRYPASAGDEGDPLELAEQRTETYWNRRIAQISTPSITGRSRIEASYEESDKREWHCQCPHCQEHFEIRFEHIEWEKDETKKGRARHLTDTARVCCPECGTLWSEMDRQRAIDAGRWQATAPFNGTAGFRISAFGCKRADLAKIALRWVRAKGFPEREKAFRNLVEGLCWEESGEAPEHERLYERREQYAVRKLPAGALILTAGVDVQKDRIEAEIVGWGRDLESWSIDFRVLEGNTEQDEVWKKLEKVLNERFTHVTGAECRIARMAVDTGAMTHRVYEWRRQVADSRVILIKGYDRIPSALGRPNWVEVNSRGKSIKRGVQLWPVGVSFLKNELYSKLNLPRPEPGEASPGYCHFPQAYDEEFFRQLTAEELVTRLHRGYAKREWKKTRARNEALDCRVYARAGAAHMQLDNWTERRWRNLEKSFGINDKPEPKPEPEQAPQKPEAKKSRPVRGSGRGWLGGGGGGGRGRGNTWIR